VSPSKADFAAQVSWQQSRLNQSKHKNEKKSIQKMHIFFLISVFLLYFLVPNAENTKLIKPLFVFTKLQFYFKQIS